MFRVQRETCCLIIRDLRWQKQPKKKNNNKTLWLILNNNDNHYDRGITIFHSLFFSLSPLPSRQQPHISFRFRFSIVQECVRSNATNSDLDLIIVVRNHKNAIPVITYIHTYSNSIKTRSKRRRKNKKKKRWRWRRRRSRKGKINILLRPQRFKKKKIRYKNQAQNEIVNTYDDG